jgi:hypothetical protein
MGNDWISEQSMPTVSFRGFAVEYGELRANIDDRTIFLIVTIYP